MLNRLSGTSVDIEFYKQCKNNLISHKIDYLHDSMMQCKQFPQTAAYMWSCINNILCHSSSPNSSNSTSFDCIIEFFQTVVINFQHQNANSFCTTPSGDDDNGFSFNEMTVPAVLSHINRLDVKKSTGPDGLSSTFLKEVASKIAIPLTKLLNQSLEDGMAGNSFI